MKISSTIIRIIIFLALNFGALAIGGIFTGKGVPSDWYANIEKAPWTPPGWIFGAAWTTIMICFSFYMALLWQVVDKKKQLISLYSVQWILNVAWNPVFFYFMNISAALILICALTALIGFIMFKYWPDFKLRSVLIAPYFLWLIVATSLNGYIFLMN